MALLEKFLFISSRSYDISKQTLPKLSSQLMSMTELITGVITPKDKSQSNLLATQKVSIFTKFLVFPSVIKRRKFSLSKDYQHESMEVK